MLEQINDLSSPAICAEHCENTDGCLYFTYFIGDGHCNLCDTYAGMNSAGHTYMLIGNQKVGEGFIVKLNSSYVSYY